MSTNTVWLRDRIGIAESACLLFRFADVEGDTSDGKFPDADCRIVIGSETTTGLAAEAGKDGRSAGETCSLPVATTGESHLTRRYLRN
jgi:hypothetical protein